MDKNGKNCNKISGYLEKKGKKKMISSYKKYWFVLEGGLLLYYRSKDDYESISPCKGSISLGPPCIVKPGSNLVGVFQIQTRTATVTLRAENLEEQNRWMQAIIAEMHPNKTSNRMSHFRYSMENIPQSKDQIRNSTPESESSHNSSEDIIHRLQKMGAQSYGNPKDTLSKIASRNKERKALNYESDEEVDLRPKAEESKSTEHIYERISGEYLDKLNKKNIVIDNTEIENIVQKAMTLPNQGVNTLRIKSEENKRKTYIIENDTYAISIQQKEVPNTNEKESKKDDIKNKRSLFSGKSRQVAKSVDTAEQDIKKKKKLKHSRSFFMHRKEYNEVDFIVENDTYASVDKTNKQKPEDLPRDLNENDVKNELLKTEEENAYSVPYRNDDNKTDKVYEDIYEDNVEYAEPSAFQNKEEKSKTKKKKSREKMKENADEEKPNKKVKKRQSFIKRVWKKKDKHKDKHEEKVENKVEDKVEEEDEEEIYETVPPTVVEKVAVTDNKTVQMLSELQNILEHKMPIIIERMSNETHSPKLQSPTGSISPTIAETQENVIQSNVENVTEPPCPLLPPKAQKQDALSPFHDVPTNNKPVALPPKRRNTEPVKSLDQILDELDNEQQETNKKNKVKKLIKKFSEPDFYDTDVVLRTQKSGIHRPDIHSDELSRLLEELVKVTNAPMLIPGVTSSLNGSTLRDEELLKLLPDKQRRFSEPDYDIPRPHKSLTLVPKKEDGSVNVIGSTRFFGHVLKPSGVIITEKTNNSGSLSQLNSYAPDSLEADINKIASFHLQSGMEKPVYIPKYYKYIDKKLIEQPSSIKEDVSSPPMPPREEEDEDIENPIYIPKYYKYIDKRYSSNHKDNDNNDKINNNCSQIPENTTDFIIDNEIYAEPRSLPKFQLETDKHVDYDQDDEVFVDSLEVCKNEVSTEF
ncbi:ankyrin repeat domain-containing protein 12-like [Diabrotica virgifera virgifera]|uniref:PH domain-containing protein n=1 Tax=Diabrotica virgifera virgifera TaxID=50390 RepID=A0ABM5KV11_DIAVI|nr:ankyrin repeat domain-containing protein 12-like [Diabrotica virgifera virgifera]